MKYAINTDFGYNNIPLGERLDLIRDAGFSAVFCGWGKPGDVKAVQEEVEKHDLYLNSVHAPFTTIHHMWDEDKADAELQIQLACLKETAECGIPVMVCHAWIGFEPEKPTEAGVENFRKLLQEAHKLGVKIALENTEGEGYLRILFDHLKDEPALGFCLDTGHEYCYNYAKDLLAEFGPLIYIHVNDNLGITGDSIFWLDDAHLIPFDGIVDFDRVAKRLARLGFTDTLTCELTTANKPGRNTHDQYADLTCAEYLAKVMKAMKRLGDKIEQYQN